MTKRAAPPAGVLRITEYEVDPRDIFEEILPGNARTRPCKPVMVKHHDIPWEVHERILRRMGIEDPSKFRRS